MNRNVSAYKGAHRFICIDILQDAIYILANILFCLIKDNRTMLTFLKMGAITFLLPYHYNFILFKLFLMVQSLFSSSNYSSGYNIFFSEIIPQGTLTFFSSKQSAGQSLRLQTIPKGPISFLQIIPQGIFICLFIILEDSFSFSSKYN